jgi:Domain of unknown function (DUF4383)
MTSGDRPAHVSRARRRPSRPYKGLLADQLAAILVGSALLILGILGFIPGLTKNLDTIDPVGGKSGAMLLGIFQVSLLHNLIHIGLGLAGLVLARTFARARLYLLGGGLICLGLWLYGLLIDPHSAANVLSLNNADNWLHFGFGVAMVILGLTLAGTRVPTGAGGEVLIPED